MEFKIVLVIILLIFGWKLYKKLCWFFSGEPRINIEMIPFEAHGYNVRSRLSEVQWRDICKVIHRKNAKGGQLVCQQCGENGLKQGFNHPVECHEIWNFNESKAVQKLTGMLTLCPLCHKAKHIGLADKMGYGDKTRKHMKKYNHWSTSKVEEYIELSKKIVSEKSGKPYKLDLTYLNRSDFSFLRTTFTTDESHKCNPKFSE
jgi:hypothetical protein